MGKTHSFSHTHTETGGICKRIINIASCTYVHTRDYSTKYTHKSVWKDLLNV